MTEKLQLSDALDRAKDSSYLSLFTFLRTDMCGNEVTIEVLEWYGESAWVVALARANRYGPYPTGKLELVSEVRVERPAQELRL